MMKCSTVTQLRSSRWRLPVIEPWQVQVQFGIKMFLIFISKAASLFPCMTQGAILVVGVLSLVKTHF